MVDYHYFMNVALLVWGCVFCLIAAVCLTLGKTYNKIKKNWMFLMQLSTAVLLASDVLACIFRGQTGMQAYYIVRIANFMVFELTDLLLFFFHRYMCSYVFAGEDAEKEKTNIRWQTVCIICAAGMILAVVSQFTGLYYYFDADNYYHRSRWYILSMMLPLAGILIDLSLLLQYRRKFSRNMRLAMVSYLLLPVAASVIQAVYYGYSLINIALGISMILMYVAAVREQNVEMGLLARKQDEIAEKLEIASTLNQCVKALSSGGDRDRAIWELLGIINGYFDADRAYIFEIDFGRNILVNTHEYVRESVSEQKDNLQEIPLEVISVWIEGFKTSSAYFIPDLEQEKGTPTYEILKAQDIERLLAVPILKDGEMIGFMGVDNPRNHYEDATLLASIQFFITNSLERKKEQEYLTYLSYRDMLTRLYNRNKYIEMLEACRQRQMEQTGVAYVDLNGLKKLNDSKGHDAGDELIKKAAEVIRNIFDGYAYRIGGDEFVLVMENTEEQMFFEKLTELRKKMEEHQVSISAGGVWRKKTQDLDGMLQEAEYQMYAEKEAYYKATGDRRRRNV